MKKLDESQKVTLTIGQLKRLVKENLWDDDNKDAESEAPLPTIDELMRFLVVKASQATQAAERLACNGFLRMLETRYNVARFVAEKILKDYNEMHGTAIPLKDKNKDSLKETLIKELMQKWLDTYKAGLKTIYYASESSKDNLVVNEAMITDEEKQSFDKFASHLAKAVTEALINIREHEEPEKAKKDALDFMNKLMDMIFDFDKESESLPGVACAVEDVFYDVFDK